MFLDELTPIVKELTQQPIAFLGGFVSGILRINLQDDPVKSWLEQQGFAAADSGSAADNSSKSGPQSITID